MSAGSSDTLPLKPFGPVAAAEWQADGFFSSEISGAGDGSGGSFTLTLNEPNDTSVPVRSMKIMAIDFSAGAAALEGTQALIRATGKVFGPGPDQIIVQGWLMSGSLAVLTLMGGDRGGVGGEPAAFYPYTPIYDHGWFHPPGGGNASQTFALYFECANSALITAVSLKVFGLYKLWKPFR